MSRDLQRLIQLRRSVPIPDGKWKYDSQIPLLDVRENVPLLRTMMLDLAELHRAYKEDGFLPAPDGVANGETHIADTIDGRPFCVTFGLAVLHILLTGMQRAGKSYAMAKILSSLAASRSFATLVFDPNQTFRNIDCMRATHEFIRASDHFRFDPYCDLPNVNPDLVSTVINKELSENYNFKYGEFLLNETVVELRAWGSPVCMSSILDHLSKKTYTGPHIRKNMYRDSVVLALTTLLISTGDLFRCKKGFDLLQLCSGNTVIEIDGILDQAVVLLVRLIFELLHLVAKASSVKLERPLFAALDEGQLLADEKTVGFAQKMLTLRHANIGLIVGFQNASTVPVELAGNCDLHMAFQCVHNDDRAAFSKMAGLLPEQALKLSSLGTGECVCFVPRLNHG